MADTAEVEGVSPPLEVKVVQQKKVKTPYDSTDSDIDDMFMSNEEIEEFENGEK